MYYSWSLFDHFLKHLLGFCQLSKNAINSLSELFHRYFIITILINSRMVDVESLTTLPISVQRRKHFMFNQGLKISTIAASKTLSRIVYS